MDEIKIMDEIKTLQELYEKLDKARTEEDFATMTDLIVGRMEDKFKFKPAFSDFREIIIDFLIENWTEEQTPAEEEWYTNILHYRYRLSREHAREVYDELKRFHDFAGC